MEGTCKSLTELEYFCEEVYKATTEKLDRINPEGRQYPYDLRKPLPLILNYQGHHVIPFHHFINNDLEYLRGGISHWGKKRRQFYAFATTRESAHDIYSKRRIIAVTKVEIVKWPNYKHLDWITVRRDDDILYKFKEEDFIYENKDKKNRLMRIDELHKFSDGTLDDVRTALNDRLKGIRMEYLPQTFWSQRDKVNARAMIQAIDKRLRKED
ncbi:hypothetical protein Tco_0783610 [Tanacetum coccineum]